MFRKLVPRKSVLRFADSGPAPLSATLLPTVLPACAAGLWGRTNGGADVAFELSHGVDRGRGFGAERFARARIPEGRHCRGAGGGDRRKPCAGGGGNPGQRVRPRRARPPSGG